MYVLKKTELFQTQVRQKYIKLKTLKKDRLH